MWRPYLTFRSAYPPCGRNARVSQVLVRFFRHMPRSLWTPADPRKAHQGAFFVLASGPLKPSPSAFWTVDTVTPNNGAISRLQEVWSSLWPTSFPVYASMMLFESWCQRFVFDASAPLVEVAGIPASTPRFSLFDGNSSNRLSCLLHHCNTRYEWLVRPCSAGTFTLQETPSFAWRTNETVEKPKF